MEEIIEKLDLTAIRSDIGIKLISISDLIDSMLTDSAYLEIRDIKDYNYKDKIILAMFINKYIGINPTVTKYNKYFYLLYDKIEPLTYIPIFRNFFVNADILYKTGINKKYDKIIQIGVFPSFLETYLSIVSIPQQTDFIQIKSLKFNPNSANAELYSKLTESYKHKFPMTNIISIDNFYQTPITQLPINQQYSLIIFDTYKNLYMGNLDDIPSKINSRFLSAIVHAKYIFHQLLFALHKLKMGGDLLMLLPGFEHPIYKQLIALIASLFDNVQLFSPSFDYSYRYFLIAKKYIPNQSIKLDFDLKIKNDDVLINILPNNTELSINKRLNRKFEIIGKKMIGFGSFLNNDAVIKKMYYEIYHHQLKNSRLFLSAIFNEETINTELDDAIYEYKLYLFNKLATSKIEKYEYSYITEHKYDYIGESITDEQFKSLIKSINYLDLYHLMDIDTTGLDQLWKTINIKHHTLNLDEVIKWNNIDLIFDNLKPTLTIQFTLNDITPLLLSIFYLLTTLYEGYCIYRPVDTLKYYYFVVKSEKYDKSKIEKIIGYLKHVKNITNLMQIVALPTDFLESFDMIISRLIIKNVLTFLRIKYAAIEPDYIAFFNALIRKRKLNYNPSYAS